MTLRQTPDELQALHDGAARRRDLEAQLKGWPAPEPFEISQPIPFPRDGLPPRLHEFVEEVARVVRVDPAPVAAAVSAILSAAAGNAFSVKVNAFHVEPNLARLVALVLASGERKSSLIRMLVAALDQWVKAKMQAYELQLQETRDRNAIIEKHIGHLTKEAASRGGDAARSKGLQRIREERAKLRPEPRRPWVYVSDTTSAEFVRALHRNGGGHAIISGEARHVVNMVLGSFRDDKQTDDQVFLACHGGDCIDRNRVGKAAESESLLVPNPSMAMLLAFQPDKLEAMADSAALQSSGFMGRLGITVPRSMVGLRIETGKEEPFRESLANRWSLAIGAILDARFRIVDAGTVMELVLCPEAMEARRLFSNKMEESLGAGGEFVDVVSMVSKTAGETARLASLYHLFEVADAGAMGDIGTRLEVPMECWERAEIAQDWQFRTTRQALDLTKESQEDRKARRALEWIAAKGLTVVTARDIKRGRRAEDVGEATAILTKLVAMGWARPLPPEAGKTKPRWDMYPDLSAYPDA